MNRTLKTIRNSVVGLAGQVIAILLSFISRKVFIQYLGVELLGLNSTFTSVLSTLSLAELGFQQVIVFHLYSALAKDDKAQINTLVNIYKLVYRFIGCFFIAASLLCTPFLQVFLSDVEATPQVRVYFLLQALTCTCTYFLAYKRNLLYADQSSYISGLIDAVVNSAGTLTAIAVMMLTRSYTLYMLVQLVRIYLSNLIVHIICTKRYPYLHAEKINWPLLKTIIGDLKDVVVEKLAGYIYGSTDNLLISMFISTVQVGFLSNYTIVITHVKRLISSMTQPLTPAIGHLVSMGQKHENRMETFRLIELAYFWLTGITVIPVFVLLDFFITMYFGAEFVLPKIILFLLCADMYISISQEVCHSFLSAHGLFRKRRNISIGGAACNVVVSMLFMKPMGTAGILAGTAISQIFYWVSRSIVTFRDCLKQDRRALAVYWMRQVWLLGVILLTAAVSGFVTQRVFVINSFITFVIQILNLRNKS